MVLPLINLRCLLERSYKVELLGKLNLQVYRLYEEITNECCGRS